MKKIWLLTTLLFGSFLFAGCTTNPLQNSEIIDYCALDNSCTIEEPVAIDDNTEKGNSLILVFSPTGNTKRIATFISEITDADLTEIIPVE